MTIGEPLPVKDGVNDRLYRTGYFAQFLAERGHDVTWWSSTFNHMLKKRLFDDDVRIAVRPGLELRLLKSLGYKTNISMARLRDHRQIAARFAAAATASPTPDIVVCAMPTIELSLAASRYGARVGVPVVMDVRDMWPDVFLDSVPAALRPIAKLALTSLYREARLACSGAAAISGVTEAFVSWGLRVGERARTRLDKAFPMGYKTEPPSEDEIADGERYWDTLGVTRASGEFVVCFFGTLGRQFDLETVIDVARRFDREGKLFRFVLCGTGDKHELYRRMAEGVKSILFPGWVNAAQIYTLQRRSAVGLNPLVDTANFRANINNKAIEYMSAGLPAVSSPDRGVLADLIRDRQCGVTYASGDADGLYSALEAARRDPAFRGEMARNASRLFEESFRAERVYEAMAAYLGEVCRASGLVV